MDTPKRSETGLKLIETVGKHWKAAISADPTYIGKLVDAPKRFETV